MKVTFNQWDCILEKKTYPNNRIALQLIDAEDGSPVAMVTVNLPDEQLNDDEVLIKDYSENEGIYQTLVDAKVISEAIGCAQSGLFVWIPKCKILI
jgi:hypothetical protein